MNKRILKFEAVEIKKIPGFSPPGFSVSELKPQINIIYGPNAVGKTTLSRALRHLIWPETSTAATNIIRGNFIIDQNRWLVNIDAGDVYYQKDGSQSPGPSLPPAEHVDRYFIALHDLLQKDTADRSFAEIIIRESAGGYQISDAVSLLEFKDRLSRAGHTTRQAGNRISEYREARRKQQELGVEERKLKPLYTELEEIKEARKGLDIINQVIGYREAAGDYEGVLFKFKEFPDEMAGITGDEDQRLIQLKGEIRRYRKNIEAAEKNRDEASKVLKEVALPEEGIKERFFTELKNRRDRLDKQETRVEQLRTDLKEAETRVEEEKIHFKGSVPERGLAEIETATYQDLADFARKAGGVHQRYKSLGRLRSFLNPEKEAPGEEGVIQDGIRFLEDWLQAPAESPGDAAGSDGKSKLRKVSLFAGLIISLLSLLLVSFTNPLFSVLLLAGGGLIWYGYGRKAPGTDYRKIAREGYAGLSLDPPEEWEKAAVRRRLQELSSLGAEIRFWQSRQNYWEPYREEYRDIVELEEEIGRERERIVEEYGFAPGTDEQALFYLTECILSWQNKRNIVRGLRSKLAEQQLLYNELLQKLNEMLKVYGYEPAADTSRISGNITDLEERNRRFQEAVRAEAEAGTVIARDGAGLQEAEGEKEALFSGLELEIDNEAELKELCYRYQDYKKIEDELKEKRYICNREREKLLNLSEFDQSLLEKDLPELREIKREHLTRAERYDEVYKRINEIETMIKSAKEENRVEEALAEKERALDLLEDELGDEYEKLAGKVLADYLKEVHTVENRPGVFRKAREIFTEITRGAYQLEIADAEQPSFRAVDTSSGLGKGLDELSSGTRIQLLLAVRMAFVDREEGELALPLYLDETLANSDDQRAKAIIEAVIELARRGRQCFYFTAQQDEVKKWVTIMEGEAGIEYKVVDLTGGQNTEIDVDIPGIEDLPEIETVPPAGGLSYEEYREKIGVPGFNPRKGAGAAHLWYLTEDLELLKYFLEMGIKRWGQLKALLENGIGGLISENRQEMLEELEIMGCCLEEFAESWKVGRGIPVDRSVLLASKAVSSNFIDEVADLARKVDGDGEAIIRELRRGAVANFLTRKTDDLERYFEEEGYINPAEVLSGEEIYLRMIGSTISKKNPPAGEMGKKARRLLKRLTG